MQSSSPNNCNRNENETCIDLKLALCDRLTSKHRSEGNATMHAIAICCVQTMPTIRSASHTHGHRDAIEGQTMAMYILSIAIFTFHSVAGPRTTTVALLLLPHAHIYLLCSFLLLNHVCYSHEVHEPGDDVNARNKY